MVLTVIESKFSLHGATFGVGRVRNERAIYSLYSPSQSLRRKNVYGVFSLSVSIVTVCSLIAPTNASSAGIVSADGLAIKANYQPAAPSSASSQLNVALVSEILETANPTGFAHAGM